MGTTTSPEVVPMSSTDVSPTDPIVPRSASGRDDRLRLVALMAAMAAHDIDALFAFVDEFGGRLLANLRAQLRSYGRADLLRDQDELGHLLHTAALVIYDRAAAWRPDGAPPWVWAAPAIRSAVAREIGHACADVDPDRLAEVAGLDGRSWTRTHLDVDLDALAGREPRFDLFRRAVEASTTRRDQEVVEQYLLQQALGDPSPSHTVAADLDLSPACVRQVVARARRRVRALSAGDERYRDLRDEGWLAA